MGNCLKRAGGNQQDNTTLLSNPDPALTSGSSQEALEPPILYNEVVPPYYQPITSSRDRHLQSSHLNFNHGLGVNLGLGGPGSLSEEEQIKIAKRLGLIQHLPLGRYDGIKKGECVICMMDLVVGEQVRYLPCMHTYHAVCIDDWLMRSLTCPSCMEPVDSALLNSYHPGT